MIVADSRQVSIADDLPIYVTSESRDSDWGQPEASHYRFTVIDCRLLGQLIGGVYLSSSSVQPIDPDLEAEFEAWQAARDEALRNFEAPLD